MFIKERDIMKYRILLVIITVMFVYLFISLIGSYDDVTDFVPFLQPILDGRAYVSAYDFFFVLSILVIRIFWLYFGIHLMTSVHGIRRMVSNLRPQDIAVLIGAGIAVYVFVCPFLYQIFLEPISALKDAPDPIRRAGIVFLFLLWFLAVGIISRRGQAISGSANFSLQQGGQQMPAPPIY